jgi:serine/threonine protein kinase/Tol biopolymer transport system component
MLGQYEILSPLGTGGMGEVYRARDSQLNRDVAIKVLHDISSKNPAGLRRFEQEARAVAALNHPNILAIYQMGNHEGAPYLVSELLEGETLRERLKHGPMPLRKVIDYGVQIARGLAAAHEKGIVHRDLKPENLFLTKDGQVKILDFGLARMGQPDEAPGKLNRSPADITEPGIVLGTAAYMSPEQVRGQAVDHRSDIFAFSSILYEMLTGNRAFQKPTSVETMSAILNDDPPALALRAPSTPPAVQRVVQRGLEKKPEQRFQSASDLAFALEALTDMSASFLTAGYVLTAEKPRNRRTAQMIITLAALIALMVVAYLKYQPAAVPRVSNYVQITHDGLQKSLIGTDGTRLYLFLISSGVQGVATIQISGGQQTNIAMPGPNMAPVSLSADGSEFLVVEGHGVPPKGPLWSLPVLGGSPQRLGDTVGQDGAWSPDGKTLAYTNAGNLYLAKADGTASRKLMGMSGFLFDPVWSPDGSHLQFDSSDSLEPGSGQHLVWEVAADGSNPHQLLAGWRNTSDACCGKWSADGKYFVFQSQGQIWALPPERRFLHPESKPVELTSSPMSLHSPLPGKDGKRLFVVGRTYRGELARYDLKSGQFSPFLGGISAEYVAFSKDGQSVAYVSYPEGALWKSKPDGSGRVQLTFPPASPVLPRWSPDGKTIVYFEFPVSPTRPARIYQVASDGGTPSELMPHDPHNQHDPNWSPDGSRIVFAGEVSDAASGHLSPVVRVLELATGQVSTLPGSQGLFSPRWSPDGRYIAAMTSDSSAVLLYDFQTQKWTGISKGTLGWLNWSKDGQYLYVLDFTGKGAVLRIRLSDHESEQVVDLKDFVTTGLWGGSLSLAPDDSPLLLRDRGTQDIYALDWIEP